MFLHTLSPRFCETDALGHINNTVLPVWFEQAREPIFRLFSPELDTETWRLIIARIEVEFTAQLKYGSDVEIRTYLEKVGNSSMYIHHEAWQKDVLAARGKTVLIHYDYEAEKATPIPDDIRQILLEHIQ
ncbi:acyl-CoA thioesterase [Endozoicomonas numazuensis]|uniref:Thioesterase n=1 Tax=Endozoicomonas numazuensis TaxID=1137799 RepID=A0A081NCZ8_9GAMM|nr:thioesterase family protein [Endozoicomonas numazuensis]KEQ16321.1 thioesterase [Endozoicomonas numazuensis]